MSKQNFINTAHIEGLVYDHSLELKTSGPNSKNPGTPFINGVLNVVTDDKLTNVIAIHFSYVTSVTSKGRPNETFNILQAIIDGSAATVMRDGADKASKVRIDSAIDLNEWFDNRSPDHALVSVKRNEGGFVHYAPDLNSDENQRATFSTDIIITGANRFENEDSSERMKLRGYIFNFRKEMLPVEYDVTNPRAMDYFEGLDASPSNPVFTLVKGIQVSQTIEKEIREESAWGEVVVRPVKSSQKAYIVTYANAEPYMFDDESTILASEVKEKLAQREIHLAEIKKRQDDYAAQKSNAPGAFATPTTAEYKF